MEDHEFDPAAYALDAQTQKERAEFERRLASDPALARETRANTEAAAALGLAAASTPPASLKRNVLAAIKSARQEEPPAAGTAAAGSAAAAPARERGASAPAGSQAAAPAPEPEVEGAVPEPEVEDAAPEPAAPVPEPTGPAAEGRAQASARRTPAGPRPLDRRWLTGLALAASALLVAATALGGILVAEQRQQAELRDQVAAMQDEAEQMRRLLQAADVRSATAETPEGNAVVLVYSAGQGLMTVSGEDLPAAPSGHAYELWLISGSGAVPAGFLPAGDVAVIDGPMEGVTHLGITVEPERGSEQPTTDPIVLQQL